VPGSRQLCRLGPIPFGSARTPPGRTPASGPFPFSCPPAGPRASPRRYAAATTGPPAPTSPGGRQAPRQVASPGAAGHPAQRILRRQQAGHADGKRPSPSVSARRDDRAGHPDHCLIPAAAVQVYDSTTVVEIFSGRGRLPPPGDCVLRRSSIGYGPTQSPELTSTGCWSARSRSCLGRRRRARIASVSSGYIEVSWRRGQLEPEIGCPAWRDRAELAADGVHGHARVLAADLFVCPEANEAATRLSTSVSDGQPVLHHLPTWCVHFSAGHRRRA